MKYLLSQEEYDELLNQADVEEVVDEEDNLRKDVIKALEYGKMETLYEPSTMSDIMYIKLTKEQCPPRIWDYIKRIAGSKS